MEQGKKRGEKSFKKRLGKKKSQKRFEEKKNEEQQTTHNINNRKRERINKKQ